LFNIPQFNIARAFSRLMSKNKMEIFTDDKRKRISNWDSSEIILLRQLVQENMSTLRSLYISVSIRVLYVANEDQTLSDASPFVVCICLVWLCNCTKYHWNLYGRRTQRANSTSCCICLCILLNLIISEFLEEDVYRRRTQRANSSSLNYVCRICLFVCSSVQFFIPWKEVCRRWTQSA